MEVLNPATGEVIAEVPRGTAEDVERPSRPRRRRGTNGSQKTPKDRMELLLKLADVIDENAEELARLESLNVGKPWWVAVDEPGAMSDCLRFFAGAARNLEGKSAAEYVEGYTSMIRREPLGIVAGICPWNYPLYMAIWKIGPGARGRQRPDHQAGRADAADPAALRRARAGGRFRPGVLQVVTGDGIPAGDALVRHPEIRLVSLTGDTATGKIIAKNAADTVKRAPPRARRQGADGRARRRRPRHRRRGDQDRRLLQLRPGLHGVVAHPRVEAAIYDDVLSETVKAVEGMSVGDPGDGRRDRDGPGHLRRSSRSASSASSSAPTDAKATIVTGGEALGERGFFVKPTIVTDVGQDAEIVQNEVFGPVVTVQPFASDDEAIEMANGVRYGLAASVFSENVGRAMKVAGEARLRHGLGQRAPLPAHARDAARRLQGVGLRQGHVDLLDGGVHPRQARRREARRVTVLVVPPDA